MTDTSTPTTEARLLVRMPRELHQALTALAQSEHRSLNQEIVHILTQHATTETHR